MPADADIAREQGSSALHDVDIHHARAQVQQCDHLTRRRLVVVFVAVLQREGSEIFFTITECPLTAVATAFDLISLSVNNFEIAVETVPESTIMESTTISGAKGSSPRWATSIPSRPRFSSTALMLEDPTSRPTIVFAPNPNMCPPLRLPGSFHGCLRFLLASCVHLVRL